MNDRVLEKTREIRDSTRMDATLIRRKLKSLRLSQSNRQMVDYWMSLSEDGAIPVRSAFDPTAASELLRGCTLFDVVPGERVTCRIAGMVFKLILGSNIAGQDWLALTAPRHREQRMARYSAIAQGAVGVARRTASSNGQDPVQIEEVMLPFAGVAEDGATQVLVHTDWRPEGDEWFGVDSTYAITLADDFYLVPLQ